MASPIWRAHNDLGQFDDARRCIAEAMTTAETTKERWSEAEVNRVAGEIAVKSSKPLRTRKSISSTHSPSRVSSKQSPLNCEPP